MADKPTLLYVAYMANVLKQLKLAFQKLLDFFPTTVPRGATEFQAWSTRLIQTYDVPDNASVRWVLARIVLDLGKPYDVIKPNRYFGLALRLAASKEVASYFFIKIKQDHDAAMAAANQQVNLPKPSEATPGLKVVTSNENQH